MGLPFTSDHSLLSPRYHVSKLRAPFPPLRPFHRPVGANLPPSLILLFPLILSALRISCMEFVIDGRAAGPLDFIMVSQDWAAVLLNSSSLWTQIYIQNVEDEIARISTFLHLSKQFKVHADVMTMLPTVASMRLVAEHVSRVRTISIRPGTSGTLTALHAEQWTRGAAYILEILSNGMWLSDVESPTCLGVTIWNGMQAYCHVVRMQFTVAARVASIDELNYNWGDHITKYASVD
jgi:hypothetical protein